MSLKPENNGICLERYKTRVCLTYSSVQDSTSPRGEWDVGDCASLAVQVSFSSDTGVISLSEPPCKASPASQVSHRL